MVVRLPHGLGATAYVELDSWVSHRSVGGRRATRLDREPNLSMPTRAFLISDMRKLRGGERGLDSHAKTRLDAASEFRIEKPSK